MTEESKRKAIVEAARSMNALGLNHGTAGNISARDGDAMLITPSGISYATMTPQMIARMPLASDGESQGPLAPSSEWRMHRDILRARPDVQAVVHAHSTYATTLAALRREIPPVHYMIGIFRTSRIRCTDYAPFGSQALSDLAVEGLGRAHGVLLGNHGMIALGEGLERAMWRAVELEALAQLYYLARMAGEPALISEAEIESEIARFENYGLKSVK
ncbi:class II aldolase/adducin family protein [Methylosinus sp. LW4]|uniref:class II aldolase/adducin family protein n=1 Tax=Methylosinus sp. LW4 TaxID=136993 RepID=UPI0003818E72|nr:class II aldolase/adducin family protein [Methylosinus sp. LW4]